MSNINLINKDYINFIYKKFKRSKQKRLLNLNYKNGILSFKECGKKIVFNYSSNDELKNLIGNLNEVFSEEVYKDLDVREKNVIDVGASIGDSAIYFALKGAKHVYAFEPFLKPYKKALKNVKSNFLKGKISMINKGVGKREEKINANQSYENTVDKMLKHYEDGKITKVTSLKNILNGLKLKNCDLKMDVEGAEYEILLNASKSTLQKFGEIILEYHHGYKNIIQKLRASGFKIEYNKIMSIKSQQGIIFATLRT